MRALTMQAQETVTAATRCASSTEDRGVVQNRSRRTTLGRILTSRWLRVGSGHLANVFISYRRSDSTSGYASWIYSALRKEYGADSIFMDVDSIPYGADFVEHLQSKLDVCEVALVLIGPHWLDAHDDVGGRRLDDPNDFVRIEVGALLQKAGIHVIPVLFDSASVPDAAALPDDLKPLARRQALAFHRAGGVSLKQILRAIEEVTNEPRPWKRWAVFAAAAAIVVAAIAIAVVALGGGNGRPSTTTGGNEAGKAAATTPLASEGRLKVFRTTYAGNSLITLKYPSELRASIESTMDSQYNGQVVLRFARPGETATVTSYGSNQVSSGTNASDPCSWRSGFARRREGRRGTAKLGGTRTSPRTASTRRPPSAGRSQLQRPQSRRMSPRSERPVGP